MLGRLGGDGEALDAASRNARLSHEILEEIVEHTDGVPLFVEELTKTVLEADCSTMRATVCAARPLPAARHSRDAARLADCAPRSPRPGQGGRAESLRCIGREFAYELIAPFAGVPRRLASRPRAAGAAELAVPRGVPPDATYMFKHALVQDAAYSTLLRGRRQELHAGVARGAGRAFRRSRRAPTGSVGAPFHSKRASRSGGCSTRSERGQLASDRSAYLEATRHFKTGIELLATLPDTPQRAHQELALHVALGAAQIVGERPRRGRGGAGVSEGA